MILLKCGIQQQQQKKTKQNRNRHIDIENELIVAKGQRIGGNEKLKNKAIKDETKILNY